MQRNKLRITAVRLGAYRDTLKEIVNIKNGILPRDVRQQKFRSPPGSPVRVESLASHSPSDKITSREAIQTP